MSSLEKSGFQKVTTESVRITSKTSSPQKTPNFPTENLGYGEAKQIKARRKITKLPFVCVFMTQTVHSK